MLLHTFGTIGRIIRRKDVPKITALAAALESGAAVSRFSEDDCAVLARYAEERDSRYLRYRAFVRLVDQTLEVLPPDGVQRRQVLADAGRREKRWRG